MANSTGKIRLRKKDIDFLIECPESGMGYQTVNITLKNKQTLNNRVVLNSEFLLLEDNEDIDPNLIEKIELVKQ